MLLLYDSLKVKIWTFDGSMTRNLYQLSQKIWLIKKQDSISQTVVAMRSFWDMAAYLLNGTASGKLNSLCATAAIESGITSAHASRGAPEFSVWNVNDLPITEKIE